MTLADEDIKSIPTDNATWASPGNVEMHVNQHCGQTVTNVSGAIFSGQICEKCKWCHKVVKFVTHAIYAILGNLFLKNRILEEKHFFSTMVGETV